MRECELTASKFPSLFMGEGVWGWGRAKKRATIYSFTAPNLMPEMK